MNQKMPRGHSNVRVEEMTQQDAKAIIPIEGGATIDTVRPLPPLVLTRREWKAIGDRMDWFKSAAC